MVVQVWTIDDEVEVIEFEDGSSAEIENLYTFRFRAVHHDALFSTEPYTTELGYS